MKSLAETYRMKKSFLQENIDVCANESMRDFKSFNQLFRTKFFKYHAIGRTRIIAEV